MAGETVATLVDAIDDARDIAGAYEMVFCLKKPSEVAGFAFICPCGCGRHGWLQFRPGPPPSWEWNGNREKPTLRPSVRQVGGCQWHGWLTDGVWRSC